MGRAELTTLVGWKPGKGTWVCETCGRAVGRYSSTEHPLGAYIVGCVEYPVAKVEELTLENS